MIAGLISIPTKPSYSDLYFCKPLNIKFINQFRHLTVMIKQLSQKTAEQLCAQQVITSLPDCIKELVDNSIDAGSTYIKIVLYEYGKHKIEVIDNGFGISDFDFLGKKGSTSKNKGNDHFNYLGFRGEAIHSIGRVSAAMTIESKCSVDGFRRLFNVNTHALQVFKQQRLCHGEFNFQVTNQQNSRSTGTKVTIEDIFKNLPVRHIQLQSKFKEFLKKTNDLIKEFCLIYPEIQFIFINTRQGKPEIIIQTSCLKIFNRSNWLERIKELDERIGNNLVYISGQLFEGYVLNKIESGSSRENNFIKKNYHYLFLNRRPIDVVNVLQSALNQIYKKYNNNTKYAFLINLKLSHNMIDVNLTPNKREVFIRKEVLERIVKDLKEKIVEKVIQDIPTLSNYEEKKKGSQVDQKGSASQSTLMDHFSQRQNSTSQIRKTVHFPINREESQFNNNQQENNRQIMQSRTDDKYSNFRDSINGARSSMHASNHSGQESKKDLVSKSSKVLPDLPELQKINIDRDKLKEKLNSRLSINLAQLKRTSNEPSIISVPPAVDRSEPIDTTELEDIRRQNQEKKVRQQEEDAKRRAQFLKEVKIEYSEQQNVKKPKIIIEKYMQLNGSNKRQYKPKQNLMEQQVQRLHEDQSYYPHPTNHQDDIEQIPSSAFKQIEPSDKKLQSRIKSKLNIDMSQIFTKFNKSKSLQQQRQSSTNKIANALVHSISNCKDDRMNACENVNERVHVCENNDQVVIANQQINNNEIHIEEAVMIDGRGNISKKSIKKENFRQFEIIGQFNMGFILCIYNHEYFLVDQHAASQKYHYELFLNKSRKLQSIKSQETQQISSIQADEIEESKYLLTQAGFYYQIRDRNQLELERCPVFYETKLGLDYFWQIVEQKKQLYRISKFTAMCAMKACKTAVVVGNALRYNEMKKIVSNLADLQSPWNCPHGRPTLVQLGRRQALRSKVTLGKNNKKYQF